MTTTADNLPYVLVVDDDQAIRETLTMVLEEEGYRVVSVAHGRAALDHLRNAAAPCLILLDLMMPVMNGWEFCAAVRSDAALVGLPVLLLSADPSVRRTAAELGAQGALAKPTDINELLDAVAPFYQHELRLEA
ncbi:MAG TPA: response regulator [Roseiflexaceae bacterium]|nr:response regulator [Roseiflexaceae bacterium]